MNKYFVYLYFKTSNTNFEYSGKFRNYLFKISRKKLEIITTFNSADSLDVLTNFRDSQDEIEKSDGFGLLLDIIAISTELVTSYQSEGFVFNSSQSLLKDFHNSTKTFDAFYTDLRREKHYSCGELGEWPVLIREGESATYKQEYLDMAKLLLEHLISYKGYTNAHITQFNYWRKALVFDNLYFWDESFLNYYKIIEYYLEKHRSKTGTTKKLLAVLLNKKIEPTKEDIEKMIKSLNITPRGDNVQLILDFRDIRNNWDIAHHTLKKTQGKRAVTHRESSYNFSYYWEISEYWDYIQEISRLFLLRDTGLLNVDLLDDGGLLKLNKS